MLGVAASRALRLYCAPRAVRFAAALDDADGAQQAALARIVRAAARTDYGRSVGLRGKESVDGFRGTVPIVDYDALERWVDAQRGGRRDALTAGPIHCYERTSGSTGACKYIPYNAALLGAFRSAFAIWAYDLLSHVLRPRSARVFMSVSAPVAGNGFTHDRDYLGTPLRAMLGPFIVSPAQTYDPIDFRDALACALIDADDLEIVSVWNPSYLLVLLEHIEARREHLLARLRGTRRNLIASDPIDWQRVWPALQLISCWTAAAAAAPACALARRFPRALMQGKGLLATEAPITVPLAAAGGCVPLIDEIFLEFVDPMGRARLLSQVERGSEYELIVTQPGGLLRYRLGDRVRVSGQYRGTPLIEFIGRSGLVCDLVGEKLCDAFVANALASVAPPDAFCTLLPVIPAQGRPHYCLLTDDSTPGLAGALDAALAQAYRYGEARALNQLDTVEALACRDMRRIVHDAFIASGRKAGDIKDTALVVSLEVAAHVYRYIGQRLAR